MNSVNEGVLDFQGPFGSCGAFMSDGGSGSSRGGLGMAGQCPGTSYSLVVQEGLRYLCRAALWTGGALGRELEQLSPGDPPSV